MKKLAVVSWLLAAVCALGAGIWDGLGEDPLGPNGAPVAGNGGGSEFLPFPHKGQPTPRPRGPGAVDFFVSTNNQTYEGFPGARSFGLQGSGNVRLRLLTEDPYDPRVEIIGDEYNETNTVTIKQGDYDSGPQPVSGSPVFELPVPESGNTITIEQEGTEYTETHAVKDSPTFTLPAPPAPFQETNTVTIAVPGGASDSQAVSNSPSFTLPDPEITISSRGATETKKVWGNPSFTLPDPTITFSSGGSSETKHVLDNPEFRYVSPPNPDDYADWLWATNMDGATANIYAYIGNREDVTVPEYLDGYKVVSLDARYAGPESVVAANRAGGAAADFVFSSIDTYYPWASNWITAWNSSHPDAPYSVSVGGTRRTRAQVRELVASGDRTDCEDDESLDALVDDYLDSLVDVDAGGSGGSPRVAPRSVFPQYYGNSLNVDNGFKDGFGYNRTNQSVFAKNCENARASGYRPDNFSPKALRWDGVEWPFGGYGFAWSDLEEVYMPHVYWVGQYSFVQCQKLASARFPELRGKVGMYAFSSTRDLAVLDLGFVSNMPGTVFGSHINGAADLQIWIDGPRPSWTTNQNAGGHWTTSALTNSPYGTVVHYRRGMPGWDEYWSDQEKVVDGPGFFGLRPAVAEVTTYEEPGGWGAPEGGAGDWHVSSNQVGVLGNIRLDGSEGSLRLEAPAFDPYGCARRLRVWDMGSSAVAVKGAANEALAIVGPGEVREFVWGGDASPAAKKWRVLGQTFTDPMGFGDNVFGATESHPETDLSALQYVTAIGAGALSGGGNHVGVAAVGHYAGKDSTNLQWTTLIGNEAGARSEGLFRAAAVGPMTFDGAEGVSNSVAIGVWAGANANSVSNQVFIDAHDIGAENNRGGAGAGTRAAEPAYDPTAAAVWIDDGDVYLGRDTNNVYFNTTYKGRHATNNVNHLRGNWVVDGTLSPIQDSVTSVERRIEALEGGETYYCRWDTTDVSQSQVNWIPTNGWPSTSIDLQLYPATSNLFVGIRESWEPTNSLRIAITLTRTALESGTTSGGIRIGAGTVATFQSTSNRRRYELTWVPELKVWMLDDYALAYHNFVFNSSGAASYISLPNDVFLPEFDDATE